MAFSAHKDPEQLIEHVEEDEALQKKVGFGKCFWVMDENRPRSWPIASRPPNTSSSLRVLE